MTTAERIEMLRAHAEAARRRARDATVEAHHDDAEIARLRGDVLQSGFCRALAECAMYQTDESVEVMRWFYVRVQASRCMNGCLDGVPESDRAEVLAAVEQLKREGYVPPGSMP